MKLTGLEIKRAAEAHKDSLEWTGISKSILMYKEVSFVQGANWAISQMQPEWVPVTERLPQGPDIVYLVCVKNKNKENGIPLIDIAVFDSDGIWQKSTVWEDVTHWMPLPQPPTK